MDYDKLLRDHRKLVRVKDLVEQRESQMRAMMSPALIAWLGESARFYYVSVVRVTERSVVIEYNDSHDQTYEGEIFVPREIMVRDDWQTALTELRARQKVEADYAQREKRLTELRSQINSLEAQAANEAAILARDKS